MVSVVSEGTTTSSPVAAAWVAAWAISWASPTGASSPSTERPGAAASAPLITGDVTDRATAAESPQATTRSRRDLEYVVRVVTGISLSSTVGQC
ncbi:hypothetical protein FQZ97_1099100 [compost metagenome]